jgi:hypothetical protein
MKTINNIDKPLEIAPTVDEAIKKAEKDPMNHIELELMNRLEQAFQEAKDNGFPGNYDEWISTNTSRGIKRNCKIF